MGARVRWCKGVCVCASVCLPASVCHKEGWQCGQFYSLSLIDTDKHPDVREGESGREEEGAGGRERETYAISVYK